MNSLTAKLFEFSEDNYKIFTEKLVPDTKLKVIGVRTPIIKKLAKSSIKNSVNDTNLFLQEKHLYHEEMLLHGFILSFEKDIERFFDKFDAFLPHVDNWAVCDCTVMALKILAKHPVATLKKIEKYIKSNNAYTVRVGIVILLCYFLDENFNDSILEYVLSIKSENYYINMAIAWFYSVALVKQYDKTIIILEQKILPKFVQNKSIQKAIESFRISQDKKLYLRTLKI